MGGSCRLLLVAIIMMSFTDVPGQQQQQHQQQQQQQQQHQQVVDDPDWETPDDINSHLKEEPLTTNSEPTDNQNPPEIPEPQRETDHSDIPPGKREEEEEGNVNIKLPPRAGIHKLLIPDDPKPTEPPEVIVIETDKQTDEEEDDGDNGILLVCLGGGEDEVVMAQMASLLQRQGHKVTAILYGSGPREESFPDGMKIYKIPLADEDPLYPGGVGLGVTPGEEGGVEWISGRVISSRVLACWHLSRQSWVDDVVKRSKLLVTPLFLHDLCVLTLAQRAGVPTVGVLTSRVGSWWVWEHLGTLPLLSTTSVPPNAMEDESIWSRTVNIARHYGYLSALRQQWQVPALTALDPSWTPAPLHVLYAKLARILVVWDPLVHAHTPPTPLLVPVGGFSFETGHMTKDVLVPALLNRAGVVTVSPGGREAWLGHQALTALHAALQPTAYTVLWRTTFPYLKPNVTLDVSSNAKFVFREEVPLNDILSHPRHRLMISTCGESEVMASISFASPVLCIPVTTDQTLASEQLKRLGVAEVVPASEMTVTKLREALKKMTSDRGYRERSRKLGEELHDQPVSAADRLVFALERVLRKPHSRRYDHKSSGLYLLQQSNADVYLLLLVLLTIFLGIVIAASIVILPILLKKQKTKAD